ncbi:MFS transporter [Kitasatospora sp. NPDC096147]|uniref:MFS transporter n=1 Tax=Kitasatospora sp. NPDC096147 TaxID=3364093 RepID=UPI0038022CFA
MGDSQEARRARARFSVVFAVHGAVTGTFVTRIPWIQHHLGLNPGQLGIALLAPAVGAFLAMPLAPRVVHRLGPHSALRTLMALWCLALALPALAPNLPVLWLVLFLYGAVSGMASVQLNAQGVEVEQALGRSIMSGLHGLWSAGGLIASGFGVLAAGQHLDARIHLGVTALVLTALALLTCRRLPDLRTDTDRSSARSAQDTPSRFALPPRSALAIGLVGFCSVFAEGASMDWAGVYLRDVTGASPAVAAGSFTAFAATMTAARLGGDLAVRRLGPVRTVRLGGGVATLGGLLVVCADAPRLAVPGFALIGIGVATVVPLAFAAAGRTTEPSRAIAGVATITYTAGLSAPATIGLIAQAASLRASFALVTALTAGLIVTAGVLRPRPAPLRTGLPAPDGPTAPDGPSAPTGPTARRQDARGSAERR